MKPVTLPARGLTLTEMLAALAITALLMVPLAALFGQAANSGISGHAALDLNDDLRFALDRVSARIKATPLPAQPDDGADATDPSTWLAPVSYALSGANLVETDTSVTPVRTSIIATNVTAFALTAPAIGVGQPLMRIDLTLSASGVSVQGARVVRLGGRQ